MNTVFGLCYPFDDKKKTVDDKRYLAVKTAVFNPNRTAPGWDIRNAFQLEAAADSVGTVVLIDGQLKETSLPLDAFLFCPWQKASCTRPMKRRYASQSHQALD